MTNDPTLYALVDAARRTGLSVDALRKRIKRGLLQTVKGNDGLVRVRLTEADMESLKPADVQPVASRTTAVDSTIRQLEAEVGTLRERAANALGERDMARASHANAQAEVVAERARTAQAEREREEARVRAAEAEGELRGLREAMTRETRQREMLEVTLKAAETQRDAAQAVRDAQQPRQHDLFGGYIGRVVQAITGRKPRG